MEIGYNNLSEILIKIIIDRKVNIYNISKYLEDNKNSKFKKKFNEIAPNIIYFYNSINVEKEEEEKEKEIIIHEINEKNTKNKF